MLNKTHLFFSHQYIYGYQGGEGVLILITAPYGSEVLLLYIHVVVVSGFLEAHIEYVLNYMKMFWQTW